jgi:hypothetical protein
VIGTRQRWIIEERGVASLRLAAAGVMILVSCSVGESGIAPPDDAIFFPAGLAADPEGDWLYVVNSNSNLRYNTGTVVAVDVAKARADRLQTAWPACPAVDSRTGAASVVEACCRDALGARILSCKEERYIASSATVRIGSFGGAAVIQETGLGFRRLFVAVRGDPSITFVDVRTPGPGAISLGCFEPLGGLPGGAGARLCEAPWRISAEDGSPTGLRLPEEPFALALDAARSLLYVGHLTSGSPTEEEGGISVVDVCTGSAAGPKLVSAERRLFERAAAQGVSSLTLSPGGVQEPVLLATSRVYPEVAELVLPDAPACQPGMGRSGQAVEIDRGSNFVSSAFGDDPTELRGVALSEDGHTAYLLHRDPPAIVVVDRSLDPSTGQPSNRPVEVIAVCSGPTDLQVHESDPRRGRRLFVSCFETGQVLVVDPALLTVVAAIDVGRGPSALSFPEREPTIAYVSGFADNNVSVIDLDPDSPTEYTVVQRIGLPGPERAGSD